MCGFETMILPEFRGKKVRCPKCKAIGEVPGSVVERVGKLEKVTKQAPKTQDASRTDNKSKKNILIAVLILVIGAVVALILLLGD